MLSQTGCFNRHLLRQPPGVGGKEKGMQNHRGKFFQLIDIAMYDFPDCHIEKGADAVHLLHFFQLEHPTGIGKLRVFLQPRPEQGPIRPAIPVMQEVRADRAAQAVRINQSA